MRLRNNPWAVLVTLCLGVFMILMDGTIVNVAIPAIMSGLRASLDSALWVVNAYILVHAVLLITGGRLGDLLGQKTLFLAGMALFTAASAACGLAHSPGELIAARVAQGIGGALLAPQTLVVITHIFPADRRGPAFGVWTAVAGVAGVAGPALGGVIVTHAGWRWIFLVNVPVGVAGILLAAWLVPGFRMYRRHRLDVRGTLLASLGLFLVAFGLIEGGRYQWGRVAGFITVPEVLAAGVVVLALFVAAQRADKGEPLIPLEVLSSREFSLLNLASAAMTFAMIGLFLAFTIYLQSVLRLPAQTAGLTMAAMPLVTMFLPPLAGRFTDKIGGKYVLMAGLGCFAAAVGYVAALTRSGQRPAVFVPAMLLAGIGVSLTFAPLTTMAMRVVQPAMAGAASGLLNTSRQLGSILGSAAVGGLLETRLADQASSAARANALQLPPELRDRFLAGFGRATAGGLQLGGGQLPASAVAGLPAQAGHQLQALAQRSLQDGYIAAMRTALLLPVAVLILTALGCAAVREHRVQGQAPAGEPSSGSMSAQPPPGGTAPGTTALE